MPSPLLIVSTMPTIEQALRSIIHSPSLSTPTVLGAWIPRYNAAIDSVKRTATYEIGLPGYEKSDIEIRCDSGLLTVSSRSKRQYEGYVTVSAPVRPFSMSWDVEPGSKVSKATFTNGLLVILIEQGASQTIPID